MEIETTPESGVPAARKRRVTKRTALRQTYASTVSHYGKDSPRAMGLARQLRILKAEEAIRELIEAAPPISSHQADRLCALIRSGVWAGTTSPEPVAVERHDTARGA